MDVSRDVKDAFAKLSKLSTELQKISNEDRNLLDGVGFKTGSDNLVSSACTWLQKLEGGLTLVEEQKPKTYTDLRDKLLHVVGVVLAKLKLLDDRIRQQRSKTEYGMGLSITFSDAMTHAEVILRWLQSLPLSVSTKLLRRTIPLYNGVGREVGTVEYIYDKAGEGVLAETYTGVVRLLDVLQVVEIDLGAEIQDETRAFMRKAKDSAQHLFLVFYPHGSQWVAGLREVEQSSQFDDTKKVTQRPSIAHLQLDNQSYPDCFPNAVLAVVEHIKRNIVPKAVGHLL